MRNYVSRYATMYRYKWRPDTKHSASELKRSSWVQYIKHWLISSTTHASTDQLTTVLHSCWRLRAAKHVCDHAGYIRSRAKNNTIINTLGKKYDTAWGIEKTGCDYRSTMQRVKTRNVLVSRTMHGHITFWSFKKFQALLGEYHRLSLWIIGASQSFSQVANRFERSVEAISWKFIKVLDSGNLLAKDLIKQETESSIN